MDVHYITSIALKWYFFTTGSFIVYEEFCHLFMKQLRLNSQQIGITSAFGIQHFLNPLFNFIGDKFRARHLVPYVTALPSILACLLPLLPLVVSFPTCFVAPFDVKYVLENNSFHGYASVTSSYNQVKIRNYVPWLSNIFILMLLSRLFASMFEGITLATVNVATLTHLGKNREDFGSYYMWNAIGATVSIFGTALAAWLVRINICGNEKYGYFAAFIVAASLALLSLVSIPWFKFEYSNNRTINFAEIKNLLCNCHCISMYLLTWYIGLCAAFQIYWEFWYLDGLKAGPLMMGWAALIRRPVVACSHFSSSYVIKRINDVGAVALSLLLFSLSFLALSFTRIYWYVLAIDVIQACAFGLAYSALAVHFSKVGSDASSGVIMGILSMCLHVGTDSGASLMGIIFHHLGTRCTLLIYAAVSGFFFIAFIVYLKVSKQMNQYAKLNNACDGDAVKVDYDENADTVFGDKKDDDYGHDD